MERPSQPLSANTPIFPGEGEDRFIRLLESITDGFAAFDADWRFTYLNQATKRILGPDVPLPENCSAGVSGNLFPKRARH